MRDRPGRLRFQALAGIGVVLAIAGLVSASDFVTSASHESLPNVSDAEESASPSLPATLEFSPAADPTPDSRPDPTASGPAPATAVIATVDPSPSIPPTPTRAPTPAPTPTPTARITPLVTPLKSVPPATPSTGWLTVVNDAFSTSALPSWWRSYDGPYGSGPHNCAVPSHAVVDGGYLHLLMSYEASGPCGAGWYTGGLALAGASSVDQRVTVRFRIVNQGVSSHFIIPMRWPDDGLVGWPQAGEEDYCESDTSRECTTFLHYGKSNQQVAHMYSVDLGQWHTIRITRRSHVASVFIDNMSTPVWSYTGNSTTLPDTVKHVVLQQECQAKCPSGTDGSEDIQIDWVTVENPA